MIFFTQKIIKRDDLQRNPHVLYIFGDNLDRRGMGGQAGEMRREDNAFGIATKRHITHGDHRDYFHDTDPDATTIIDQEFERLWLSLMRTGSHYQAVCWPADGIGTGLSELPQRAPKLLSYINHLFEELKGWFEDLREFHSHT